MRKNKKGFTLAELLIVVAIIAVLVAIAIPIFNAQLEKARESTDVANVRDYYAEVAVALIDGTLDAGTTTTKVSGEKTATYAPTTDTTITSSSTFTVTVAGITINQKDLTGWTIGDPNVAGATIAVPASGANAILYTFGYNVSASGGVSTYLKSVEYTTA